MNASAENYRTFLALPLSPALIQEIGRLQENLKRQLDSPDIRWVKPEQTHLTLRFFGQIAATQIPDLANAIHAIGQKHPAFSLSVCGLGCFPHWDFPKILWLGIGGDLDHLHQLSQKLMTATQAWGEDAEEKAFHPHLTLARLKAIRSEARRIGSLLHEYELDFSSTWQADHLELMKSQLSSQGPAYSLLARVPLCAPKN